MKVHRIRSDRLDLIAATTEHLNAELASTSALAGLMDVKIPEGWPPGEYDSAAITLFRDRTASDAGALGWYVWYALLRSSDPGPSTLVGAGGYFGPPGNDGTVEIGYSILPRFEGQGIATELVQALVGHALSVGAVQCVHAHVNPVNVGSVRVLEKNGFKPAGPPNDDGLALWTRTREG